MKAGDINFFYGKQFQNAVTVFTSSELLSSYLSWFCLTDVAVGFVCLIFKRKHNEATYNEILLSLSRFSLQRHLFTDFHKELQ